jgi:hypothetical protein
MILKAVDAGLEALGASVRAALYHHVERVSGIKRRCIPNRINEFSKALRDVFGTGARVIEKLVAKALFDQFRLNFEEHENWALVDHVSFVIGKACEHGTDLK